MRSGKLLPFLTSIMTCVNHSTAVALCGWAKQQKVLRQLNYITLSLCFHCSGSLLFNCCSLESRWMMSTTFLVEVVWQRFELRFPRSYLHNAAIWGVCWFFSKCQSRPGRETRAWRQKLQRNKTAKSIRLDPSTGLTDVVFAWKRHFRSTGPSNVAGWKSYFERDSISVQIFPSAYLCGWDVYSSNRQ